MRVIIAGSRDVTQEQFDEAIEICHFPTLVVLSGGARGVDTYGAVWARKKGYQVEYYPAMWRVDGVYDNSAGYKRNVEMARNAQALFAVWDGASKGTKHMIDVATARGLMVQVFLTNPSYQGDTDNAPEDGSPIHADNGN